MHNVLRQERLYEKVDLQNIKATAHNRVVGKEAPIILDSEKPAGQIFYALRRKCIQFIRRISSKYLSK